MKKLLLFFFSIIAYNSLNAQTITFIDPVFKNKLLESSIDNLIAKNSQGDYFAIDANANNEIETAEALEVIELNINNSSITSLAEIAYFLNLEVLNCG